MLLGEAELRGWEVGDGASVLPPAEEKAKG